MGVEWAAGSGSTGSREPKVEASPLGCWRDRKGGGDLPVSSGRSPPSTFVPLARTRHLLSADCQPEQGYREGSGGSDGKTGARTTGYY